MSSTNENLVLCDTICTRVAGYRFHMAAPPAPGAWVEFVREPTNTWDPNAIVICDQHGKKLGYLFKEIAHEYAGLMDCGCVRLYGRMATPGEPDYDSVRVQSNPVLYLWVYADEARLAEICAQTDAASALLGGLEESNAFTGA